MKDETHENIYYKVDEDDLYDLDKMSLDEKELCKRAFEIQLKYIYDKQIQNVMNCIHENEVNKIAE